MPCDGEVLDGLAAVDESMLTGESVLVAKGVGAAVAGGCIVFEGPLTIKASATGAESTLAGAGRSRLRIQPGTTLCSRFLRSNKQMLGGSHCTGMFWMVTIHLPVPNPTSNTCFYVLHVSQALVVSWLLLRRVRLLCSVLLMRLRASFVTE